VRERSHHVQERRLVAKGSALFFVTCVYASPKGAVERGILRARALSEGAVCIFTYIGTKAALGTSTL
jgi:hypothetical protein